ncbi:hypothetical protein D9615_002868 [Tricholomella constricta]|uniref:Uncharacterized protein n=1 Tax=Tricholomella constricta TaxID=117010 RepID=A0A8H5HFG6_9AGAR|nr:hypothetical protein D9615_002868 [Tricholomella constricta]
METVRKRNPFRDSDVGDSVEDEKRILDEQEQEALIQKLKETNKSSTKRSLTVLQAILVLSFALQIFSSFKNPLLAIIPPETHDVTEDIPLPIAFTFLNLILHLNLALVAFRDEIRVRYNVSDEFMHPLPYQLSYAIAAVPPTLAMFLRRSWQSSVWWGLTLPCHRATFKLTGKMASYFPASSSKKQPLREAGYTQSALPASGSSLDDSIYVFPNPASAPPSPQHSDFSANTEFTLSPHSVTLQLPTSRDRRYSSSASPPPLTPISPCEWDGRELLETDYLADVSPLRAPRDQTERPQRERALIDYHTAAPIQTSSVDANRVLRALPEDPQHPHTRLHIPLLSFFVSLLSIEDSTMHILSYSSSDSVLFPCRTLPSDSLLENTGVDVKPHGVEKLLVRRSEGSQIREAMKSEREMAPYRSLHPLPFHGLWNTVTALVTNGGKALREVLHR